MDLTPGHRRWAANRLGEMRRENEEKQRRAAGEPRWFVDAWAVEDGRAFASYREAESTATVGRPATGDHEERTVYLEAPFFHADPVAHPAIARRAARSGFQDGLVDDSGAEIGFDSVEQIRDLVRRGYLAGGLGPQGGPQGAGPAQPTAGGGGSPYETPGDYLVPSDGPFDLPEELPEGLAGEVERLGYAYAEFIDHELPPGPHVVLFLATLARSGVLDAQTEGLLERIILRETPLLAGPVLMAPTATMRAVARELPPPPGQEGWPHVLRLADFRTLAVVDRRFWRPQLPLAHLAVVLLAGAVTRGSRAARGNALADEYRALRARSMVDLGEAAEDAITAYVDLRLGRREHRPPPSVAVYSG